MPARLRRAGRRTGGVMTRLTMWAALLVLAGAFATSAFASFAPKISVSSNADGVTRLGYTQSPTDDTPAQITFFVPDGYITTVGQPENVAFGSVSATLSAGDLAGAVVNAAGTLTGATATTAI